MTAKATFSAGGGVFRFTSVTKHLAKGGRATLKLKVGDGALTALRRALNAGSKLSAKVTLTAKDAAGNATTKRRSINLKR